MKNDKKLRRYTSCPRLSSLDNLIDQMVDETKDFSQPDPSSNEGKICDNQSRLTMEKEENSDNVQYSSTCLFDENDSVLKSKVLITVNSDSVTTEEKNILANDDEGQQCTTSFISEPCCIVQNIAMQNLNFSANYNDNVDSCQTPQTDNIDGDLSTNYTSGVHSVENPVRDGSMMNMNMSASMVPPGMSMSECHDFPDEGLQMTLSQQYRTSHFAKMGEYIRDSKYGENFYDVKIEVLPKVFFAHRVALACHSEYFAKFFADKVDKKRRYPMEIQIQGITAEAFEIFLKYVYDGEANPPPELIPDVVVAAEKFRCPALLKACYYQGMHLSLESALLILIRCAPGGAFYRTAFNIVLNKFPDVIRSANLPMLDVATLIKILSDTNLNTPSEVLVFNTVLRWIQTSETCRSDYVHQLMNCVRFQMMSSRELITCCSSYVFQEYNINRQNLLRDNWIITCKALRMADPFAFEQELPRKPFEPYDGYQPTPEHFNVIEVSGPQRNAVRSGSSTIPKKVAMQYSAAPRMSLSNSRGFGSGGGLVSDETVIKYERYVEKDGKPVIYEQRTNTEQSRSSPGGSRGGGSKTDRKFFNLTGNACDQFNMLENDDNVKFEAIKNYDYTQNHVINQSGEQPSVSNDRQKQKKFDVHQNFPRFTYKVQTVGNVSDNACNSVNSHKPMMYSTQDYYRMQSRDCRNGNDNNRFKSWHFPASYMVKDAKDCNTNVNRETKLVDAQLQHKSEKYHNKCKNIYTHNNRNPNARLKPSNEMPKVIKDDFTDNKNVDKSNKADYIATRTIDEKCDGCQTTEYNSQRKKRRLINEMNKTMTQSANFSTTPDEIYSKGDNKDKYSENVKKKNEKTAMINGQVVKRTYTSHRNRQHTHCNSVNSDQFTLNKQNENEKYLNSTDNSSVPPSDYSTIIDELGTCESMTQGQSSGRSTDKESKNEYCDIAEKTTIVKANENSDSTMYQIENDVKTENFLSNKTVETKSIMGNICLIESNKQTKQLHKTHHKTTHLFTSADFKLDERRHMSDEYISSGIDNNQCQVRETEFSKAIKKLNDSYRKKGAQERREERILSIHRKLKTDVDDTKAQESSESDNVTMSTHAQQCIVIGQASSDTSLDSGRNRASSLENGKRQNVCALKMHTIFNINQQKINENNNESMCQLPFQSLFSISESNLEQICNKEIENVNEDNTNCDDLKEKSNNARVGTSGVKADKIKDSHINTNFGKSPVTNIKSIKPVMLEKRKLPKTKRGLVATGRRPSIRMAPGGEKGDDTNIFSPSPKNSNLINEQGVLKPDNTKTDILSISQKSDKNRYISSQSNESHSYEVYTKTDYSKTDRVLSNIVENDEQSQSKAGTVISEQIQNEDNENQLPNAFVNFTKENITPSSNSLYNKYVQESVQKIVNTEDSASQFEHSKSSLVSKKDNDYQISSFFGGESTQSRIKQPPIPQEKSFAFYDDGTIPHQPQFFSIPPYKEENRQPLPEPVQNFYKDNALPSSYPQDHYQHMTHVPISIPLDPRFPYFPIYGTFIPSATTSTFIQTPVHSTKIDFPYTNLQQFDPSKEMLSSSHEGPKTSIVPIKSRPLSPQELQKAQEDAMSWRAKPVSHSGDLLVVGGHSAQRHGFSHETSIYRYSQRSEEWAPFVRLPEPRLHHAAAKLGSSLYLIGGCGITEGSKPQSTTFVFDNRTKKWSSKASMNMKRMYHRVCSMLGVLYAVGGQNERGEVLKSIECYLPNDDSWTLIKQMAVARMYPAVATCRSCLYVAGGYAGKFTREKGRPILDSVECYDPQSNEWYSCSKLRIPRYHATMLDVQGRLFVIGGAQKTNKSDIFALESLAAIDSYDPDTDVWTHLTNLLTPRHAAGSALIGTKIYIVGGISCPANREVQSIEVYDTATGKWAKDIIDLPFACRSFDCVIISHEEDK